MGFIGDLFGGKGSSSAPAPMPQTPDYSGEITQMMGMMQEMMGGVMEGMAGQMETMMSQASEQQRTMQESILNMNMSMPEMPAAYRNPEIDWTEAQGQLSQKAKADYHLDQMRRKGRQDTVLTSPLLDDEDVDVTGSILTGAG